MAYKFNPFTGNLDVVGPVLTGTGTVSAAADGTEALPGIAFANDLDTGITRTGANQIAISTGGNGRLFIDSSGNVGVGTSSPQTLLHLSASNNSLTQNNVLRFTDTDVSVAADQTIGLIEFETSDTTNPGVNAQIEAVYTSTAGFGELQFRTGTAGSLVDALRIDNAGKVGIGTTSPVSTVDCKGQLSISNSATSYWLFDRDDSDGRLKLLDSSTSTNERLAVDSSGRLLVGTSTARDNFFNSTSYDAGLQFEGADSSGIGTGSGRFFAHIYGNTAGNGPGHIFAAHRSSSVGGNTIVQSGDGLGALHFQGSDGTQFVEAARISATVDGTPGADDMPGRLTFSTTADGASSPTERMSIKSDGQVVITPGRLYVQNSEASNPLVFAYNTNNAASDITYKSELGAGSNGTSAYHFYGVTGGSGKFAIYGNGTYGTISDQNLKTHIEPARDGYLADLNQIKIVKYGWKSDELGHATELGVIAQEVEQVFPGLVQECPPNEDGEVFKGVKTSVFTFMLIKALQEASSKIESLESRIAALEAQ